MLGGLLKSIYWTLNRRIRDLRIKNMRDSLRNNNFSLITENCLAGSIYHDLNRKFLTPVINGEFSTEEYLVFLRNLDGYLNLEMTSTTSSSDKNIPEFYKRMNVPIGILCDIHFRFTHLLPSQHEKAKEDWNRRRKKS